MPEYGRYGKPGSSRHHAREGDNIIRPSQWTANGQASLRETASDDTLEAKLGGGGDGPYDPGMDKRVATLEADMRVMTGSLNRVETAITDTVKTALAKSIGPVQAVGMLAGAIGVLVAATSAVNWLVAHGYFPHSP